MTPEEAWPTIRVLAVKKLGETNDTKCGVSHIYLRRHLQLTDDDIARLPEIAFDDDELNCHNKLGDLEIWRRCE
jgi:hypothetical protein